MNLVKICPDIPDDWKGNLKETAALLGLHRATLTRYADRGKLNGGIDWQYASSGRRVFVGKEIKRFWKNM